MPGPRFAAQKHISKREGKGEAFGRKENKMEDIKSVCVYERAHTYMCVCIYVCVHISVCIHIYIAYTCARTHIHNRFTRQRGQ